MTVKMTRAYENSELLFTDVFEYTVDGKNLIFIFKEDYYSEGYIFIVDGEIVFYINSLGMSYNLNNRAIIKLFKKGHCISRLHRLIKAAGKWSYAKTTYKRLRKEGAEMKAYKTVQLTLQCVGIELKQIITN